MPNRLKEVRLKHGLTQQTLADLIGTTKQHVGRLESSKRRLNDDWVYRIVQALHIHPGELWESLDHPLSERESALIDAFRQLSKSNQAFSIQLAEAFVDAARPRSEPAELDESSDE